MTPDEILAAIEELGFEPNLESAARRDLVADGTTCDPLPDPIAAELRHASSADKHLFIDFFAEWCGPCLTLDNEILPDPALAPILARFHFLKVDTDEGTEAAQCLEVFGLPTIVVLDPGGKELFRHEGLLEPEELAKELELLPGIHTGENKP